MASYSGLGAIPLPSILDRWAANTGRSEGATAEEAVPFPRAAHRSIVRSSSRGVSVVVPVHAQLDGKSPSCSPSHPAMCWSLVGARAQLSSIESLNVSYVACVQSAFVRRLIERG